MKRIVSLGMGQGGLWLALAGQELPAGARLIDKGQARFWLRQSVPPMAHPAILHALSEISDALGYPFHGATALSIGEMPMLLEWLEDAMKAGRLVGFLADSVEGGGKGPQPQPKPPSVPPPKPTPVNPLVEPATLVVVVKKQAKNPTSGAKEPYTHPKRQPLSLKTDAAFDGTATFTCDKPDKVKFFSAAKNGTEIKFDGTGNVFKPNSAPPWAPKGTTISSGVTVFVEGVAPSGAMDDIKVKLALSGGSKPTGPDDTGTVTSVEVTLDIHKSRPQAGGDPPVFSQDDKIWVGRNLLVQGSRNQFDRAQLVIQQVKPTTFKGTLVLKAQNGHVDAFKEEDPKKAGQASLLPFEIAADKIPAAGEKLWAQGKSPSDKMLDSGFVLGIKGVEDEGDKVTVTAVQIDLDICKSRKDKKVDPEAMSEEDQVKVGRFVHEQDTGNHHGRALLIVREVKPKKFAGTLVLKAIGTGTQLFPNERPTTGEAVTAVPHEFDYSKEKNEDKKLWVQGKTVSAALRDVGYFLHLKEDRQQNADTILMTVCKFTGLTADVPRTPQRTARHGNNPVARHTYTRTATADHFDEDPAKNKPIGLVEDSVLATDQIKLSCTVLPAGTPVSWSVLRDTRPAPLGDHKDIEKLGGPPGDRADAAAPANPLRRELLANGVGTFHIRPFVDCNGSGKYEQHIDFEPYLLLIMILFRVKGHTNTSVAQDTAANNTAAFVRGIGVAGAPTSATGVRVRTGDFNAGGVSGANDAVHQIASVTVIGGGKDGLRGLDPVADCLLFAGWMNNELDTGAVGEDAVAVYLHTPPPIPNPVPGGPPIPMPPVPRQRISVRVPPALGGTTFLPGGVAPPAAWDMGPVLDTSINATAGTGGNTVVGTEGAIGPPIPIVKTALALGQRWTVEMWDSPGDSAPAAHGGFAPTRLISYRFNLDFRSDLVFWTNTTHSAAVSGANEVAHRLYSTVQTNTWSIRCSVSFDAAGNAVAPVPARATVRINKDGDPRRKATPLDGQAAETRGPQLLSMLAIDARN